MQRVIHVEQEASGVDKNRIALRMITFAIMVYNCVQLVRYILFLTVTSEFTMNTVTVVLLIPDLASRVYASLHVANVLITFLCNTWDCFCHWVLFHSFISRYSLRVVSTVGTMYPLLGCTYAVLLSLSMRYCMLHSDICSCASIYSDACTFGMNEMP